MKVEQLINKLSELKKDAEVIFYDESCFPLTINNLEDIKTTTCGELVVINFDIPRKYDENLLLDHMEKTVAYFRHLLDCRR